MPKPLPLHPERAEWLPKDPEDERRPIRCLLAGGKVEYGNVRKLPNLLWKNFGIVVVEHVAGTSPAPATAVEYDLAIALIDQSSHTLMEWAKSISERIVYCPSTWSKIQLALHEIDITPYQGRKFVRPPKPKTQDVENMKPKGPRLPVPQPKSLPAEEEPVSQQEKKEGFPREVKDLLVKLKRVMSANSIEKLELVLHGDELSVEYKRVVIQEGLEVL